MFSIVAFAFQGFRLEVPLNKGSYPKKLFLVQLFPNALDSKL
jgi:hypothetical protein